MEDLRKYCSAEVTLDLGLFGEQEVLVYYDYTPAERGSWMEPAVPAQFEIVSVYVGDTKIPSSWWDNTVCVDITKDIISSQQED